MRKQLILQIGTIGIVWCTLQITLWWMFPEPVRGGNISWWIVLSTLMAEKGMTNVWTPYPPLFPMLHLGLLRILGADMNILSSVFFEGNRTADAVLVYQEVLSSTKIAWIVFQGVLLLLLAGIIFLLLRRMASKKRALLAAGSFLLFHVTATGQITLGLSNDQFDLLAVFFLLLGTLLYLQGKPVFSGTAIGLGILTKLFPVLLLPVITFRSHDRFRWIFLVSLLVTCSLFVLPFFFANSTITLSTYTWTAARPAWEGVWSYNPRHPEARPFPALPSAVEMPDLFTQPFVKSGPRDLWAMSLPILTFATIIGYLSV